MKYSPPHMQIARQVAPELPQKSPHPRAPTKSEVIVYHTTGIEEGEEEPHQPRGLAVRGASETSSCLASMIHHASRKLRYVRGLLAAVPRVLLAERAQCHPPHCCAPPLGHTVHSQQRRG
jgi:hypothetical protein